MKSRSGSACCFKAFVMGWHVPRKVPRQAQVICFLSPYAPKQKICINFWQERVVSRAGRLATTPRPLSAGGMVAFIWMPWDKAVERRMLCWRRDFGRMRPWRETLRTEKVQEGHLGWNLYSCHCCFFNHVQKQVPSHRGKFGWVSFRLKVIGSWVVRFCCVNYFCLESQGFLSFPKFITSI